MSLMSERIFKRRRELGLTMEELGEKVGVSKSTVNKWEKGQIETIKRSTISKLATILECDPVWLMGIDEKDATIRDHYINVKEFQTAYRKKNCDVMQFLDAVDIDYDKLMDLLNGKSRAVTNKVLSQMSIYLNVQENQLIGQKLKFVRENEQYTRIINDLETIKNYLGATYTKDELAVLDLYRSADDLTKAMVRRTLGIE